MLPDFFLKLLFIIIEIIIFFKKKKENNMKNTYRQRLITYKFKK